MCESRRGFEGAQASVSALPIDAFELARLGGARRGRELLSAPVVARAAARGPVDLGIAAVLALLDLHQAPPALGAELGEAGLLDVVESLAHLEGHLSGLRQRALAALRRLPSEPPPSVGSPIAADADEWAALTLANRASGVAARCGTSPYVAGQALRRAELLIPGGAMQQVGAAVEAGRLPASKAELMADELAHVEDPLLVRDLVEAILPMARSLGVGRLREAIRAEVAHHQPADVIATHEVARSMREVARPQDEGLGMASLRVFGPSPDIAKVWGRIDRVAHAARDEASDDSIGALRFDALVDVLSGGPMPGGGEPSDSGCGPAINVIVGIDTLAGLDDQPAELGGFGLIDARTARQLAADPSGTWRRLLVDGAGRLVDRGRAYRPPPSMVSYVLARDRTCRFPGCGRTRLDVDHIIDYADGGPTAPSNLAGLCRTHHNLKTHRLWAYAIDPESGDAVWRDRHGHIAIQPASRYPRSARHRGIAASMRRARARRGIADCTRGQAPASRPPAGTGPTTVSLDRTADGLAGMGADVDDPPPF